MSLTERIKHMNKWKLGIMLVILLFSMGAAGSLIHVKASEFPLTESEKKMSMQIALESITNLPPDYKIFEPKVGWSLGTREGMKRVTYVTIETSDLSAFVAVDLEAGKAVTIVQSMDWTKRTSIVPFRFVVNYAEDPQHQFLRNVGIVILIIAILLFLVLAFKGKVGK